ncbi:MAG: hypothetical protein U0869_07315 [Chloroflexota bacterium]
MCARRWKLVASTDAALAGRHLTWVDAETVTKACSRPMGWTRRAVSDRPGTAAGWPLLLLVRHLGDAFAGLARDRMPDDLVADLAAAGVPLRELDLGDPGAVLDRDTPMAACHPFRGPRSHLRPRRPTGAPPPRTAPMTLPPHPSGRSTRMNRT